jgi:hypothetical protein
MNNAESLYSDLQSRGFTFEIIDGRLNVIPGSKLTPEDIAGVRTHKTALIDLLQPNDRLIESEINSYREGLLGWYLIKGGWSEVQQDKDYPLWKRGNGIPMPASRAWAITLDEMK